MNLQITVPYQTCPFKCPFCIANNPDVQSLFLDLYKQDKVSYFIQLKKAIERNNIKTVVLTGDTEPTLNVGWLVEVSTFIKKHFPKVSIELQTKNFNRNTIDYLVKNASVDVYALSIDNNDQRVIAASLNVGKAIKRAVVILNGRYTPSPIALDFDQITYKTIQFGENPEINKWIRENQFSSNIEIEVKAYKRNGVSVVLDENCMDSKNRYIIFREDGNIYSTWTDTEPC